MRKSARRGLSDDEDDTEGSAQPQRPGRRLEPQRLDTASVAAAPAKKSAPASAGDEEAPFAAEEAAAVKPEDALLQPTLLSLASDDPSSYFADDDDESSSFLQPSSSSSSSKKKIWRARSSKSELAGITEAGEDEKPQVSSAKTAGIKVTLRQDTQRATTPGARAVNPSAASSSQASVSTTGSPLPPPTTKLRPQTVSYMGGAQHYDDDDDENVYDDDIERQSPNDHSSVSFAGNVVVAAEVAYNADPEVLEERVRQSILDKAVKAEVVSPDEGTSDSKSVQNGKRGLRVGAVILLALIVAIIIFVVLVVRQGGSDSAGTDPQQTPNPSAAPISTGQPTGPTSFPTTTSFFEGEQALIAALGEALDTESLSDTKSPVYAAFNWLLSEDQYTPSDNIELSERYVLTLLYFSTGGPGWANQLDFLSENGHCSWGGQDETVPSPPIDCNDDLRVTDIYLEAIGLKGTLPSEIHFLSDLIVLSLHSNELSSTIPSEVGLLTSLTDLDLGSNELQGAIPSSLFNLGNLMYLELETNRLTATIPTNIGNCFRLSFLDLGQNKLTGTLPEAVSDLTLLEDLYLFENIGLNGPIPSFSKNRNLRYLLLGSCSFSSTIPLSIFDNSKLIELSISENALVGTIPTKATQMPQLEHLDLYGNSLTGTIPLFNGTPRIKTFDVEMNQLTGDINGILNGSAPTLEFVWVDVNQLTGTIPEAIGSHSLLTELRLHECDFDGTLPTSLGQLTNVEGLTVNDNNFSGTLPSELGLLTRLTYLDVCCNGLTGTLPPEWSALSKLEFLYVEKNSFTGTLPPPAWNATTFPDMLTFWSHENNFTGDISPGFCDADLSSGFQESLQSLATDCLGETAEVSCTCCKECCDSNGVCEGFQ